MCQLFLFQSSFIQKLQQYDLDTMLAKQALGCPHCGGVLDRADFRRKPRCLFDTLPDRFTIRYSLCCRRDGCRRRLTPKSIRFFGRRVFWSVAILLLSAQLVCGSSMDGRTIRRWKSFWDEDLSRSPEWQRSRGGVLMMDQAAGTLMGLLESYSPLDCDSMRGLLALVAPCWAK